MKSPFALSKEAQEEWNKERIKKFSDEYIELCKKHRLIHVAVMNATPTSLTSVLTLQEFNEPDTKGKTPKVST